MRGAAIDGISSVEFSVFSSPAAGKMGFAETDRDGDPSQDLNVSASTRIRMRHGRLFFQASPLVVDIRNLHSDPVRIVQVYLIIFFERGMRVGQRGFQRGERCLRFIVIYAEAEMVEPELLSWTLTGLAIRDEGKDYFELRVRGGFLGIYARDPTT